MSSAAKLTVQLKGASRCGNPECTELNPKHKCARCMSICYCSKDCQLSHFKEHQPLCNSIAPHLCLVKEPTLLSYDADDEEDCNIYADLNEERGNLNMQGEYFYPVIVQNQHAQRIVDKQGKYMGAFIPRSNMIKSISAITTASQHHRDSLIYNIPMFSGVARISNKYSHRLTPYVPKIYVFSSEDNSESLDHLVKWRRSSLRKPNIAVSLDDHQPTTAKENAALFIELLCLLDKTVFPTLQLFRAIGKRRVLVIEAHEFEISWQLTHPSQLLAYDPLINTRIEECNIDKSIFMLAYGTRIDRRFDTPVLMQIPLHICQAFHEQHFRHHLPQSPLILALIKRQELKFGRATIDSESEA
eukprot:gene8600-1019_t